MSKNNNNQNLTVLADFYFWDSSATLTDLSLGKERSAGCKSNRLRTTLRYFGV